MRPYLAPVLESWCGFDFACGPRQREATGMPVGKFFDDARGQERSGSGFGVRSSPVPVPVISISNQLPAQFPDFCFLYSVFCIPLLNCCSLFVKDLLSLYS